MPVEEAPEDDDVRQSYNFAPGYHGLVYRADVPDHGAGVRHHKRGEEGQNAEELSETPQETEPEVKETRYKLQSMKWGIRKISAFSLCQALTTKQGSFHFGRSATPTTDLCSKRSTVEMTPFWRIEACGTR